MIRYKKGLSTVVTTLIIVLLVLAAIGIIWSPIKNLLTQSSESFDQTKCLEIDIKATKVALANPTIHGDCEDAATGTNEQCDSTSYGFVTGSSTARCTAALCSDDVSENYYVTLTRAPTGEGEAGAKIIFFTGDIASHVVDFGAMLEPLEVVTSEALGAEQVNVDRVQVTPYYVDDNSGEQKLCPSSTEFKFSSN